MSEQLKIAKLTGILDYPGLFNSPYCHIILGDTDPVTKEGIYYVYYLVSLYMLAPLAKNLIDISQEELDLAWQDFIERHKRSK